MRIIWSLRSNWPNHIFLFIGISFDTMILHSPRFPHVFRGYFASVSFANFFLYGGCLHGPNRLTFLLSYIFSNKILFTAVTSITINFEIQMTGLEPLFSEMELLYSFKTDISVFSHCKHLKFNTFLAGLFCTSHQIYFFIRIPIVAIITSIYPLSQATYQGDIFDYPLSLTHY